MSQADSKEQSAEVSAESVSPIMLNGKAAAAAPKLSENDDNVEMKNMLSSGPNAQLDEDIMQLARLGNIPAIQKLFDAERFHPTYCDTEGITPLHVWSRIQVHLTRVLSFLSVGCNQQSVCHVQVPTRSWRRCE